MRIGVVDYKKRRDYIAMDPFFMLERLIFSGAFALEAIETDEDTGEEKPVGIVICISYDDGPAICWLYVLEEYRYRGIGESLLREVFDIAAGSGKDKVYAYFNNAPDRRETYPDEEHFFTERLFGGVIPLAGEWMTDVRQALSQSDTGRIDNKYKVKSFEESTPELREKAVELFGRDASSFRLLSSADLGEAIDLSLSFVLFDEKPCGFVLAQTVYTPQKALDAQGEVKSERRTTIYPVLAKARDKEAEEALKLAFLKRAEELYSEEAAIRIIVDMYSPEETVEDGDIFTDDGDIMTDDEDIVAEADDIVAEADDESHIDSWLLVASVSDYLALSDDQV